MAGTGIKGYTGVSSDGKYNIVNGQIVSTNPTYSTPAYTSGGAAIVNRNGAVMNDASTSGFSVNDLSTLLSNQIANVVQQTTNAMHQAQGISSQDLTNYAKQLSNVVSTSNSDYADMMREILANQNANTAKSQQFAREQMDYQTRSDQAAMAWSAAEAQKNRDWQEKLSDQAHQREVRDLLAAGLNPVLAANQGAYTGSGATGQGFSSSGAMGTVDTSANGVMGNLLSTIVSSATQAQVAQMYTDAERYAADLQYSSSRMATEASITNNENTNSSQKWIATNQMINDLKKTEIQGQYGLQNTALSNEGAYARTQYAENAANARNMNSELAANYRTNQTNASNERQTESKNASGSWLSAGPYRAIAKGIKEMLDASQYKRDQAAKKYLEKSNGRSSNPEVSSKLLRDIGWG